MVHPWGAINQSADSGSPAMDEPASDGFVVADENLSATDVASNTEAVDHGAMNASCFQNEGSSDDYPAQVSQAQAADEAAGAGITFEAKKILVTFSDATTPEEVNAFLLQSDAVATKSVAESDFVSGTVLLDVSEAYSVSQASSILEESEIVEGAQPNYLYYLMDETIVVDKEATDEKAASLSDSVAGTPTADFAKSDAASGKGVDSDHGETVIEYPSAAETQTYPSTSSGQTGDMANSNVDLGPLATSVNDPKTSQQWALLSIGAYDAWDMSTASGKVAVAIIDTGALANHEDLVDNVAATYNAATGTSDVSDSIGHGTHVTGIVSAESNNRIGVSGVSYNANLVIIKANEGDTKSFSSATIAAGYSYLLSAASSDVDGDGTIETIAQEHNVRVVNLSVGGKGECSADDVVIKQIDAAYKAGILTVCAAGNSGNGNTVPYAEYPGDYGECISVINIDSTLKKNSSSNYNEWGSTAKDISAPGTSILSTVNSSDSSYDYNSGTSMASPCVAGVAALLFAQNEFLSPAQVSSALYATAVDLGESGWDEKYGYGEVNADAAVRVASGNYSISGHEAVLTGESAQYIATTAADWTWSVVNGTGEATIDASSGLLVAVNAGLVTVRASSMADPSIIALYDVTIVDAEISGANTTVAGEPSPYLVAESSNLSWTWSISGGTGSAKVGSTSGVLIGRSSGTVTLLATSDAYPWIQLSKTISIIEAMISGPSSIGIDVEASYSVSGSLSESDWTWSAEGSDSTIDARGVLVATATGVVALSATSKYDTSVVVAKSIAVSSIDGAYSFVSSIDDDYVLDVSGGSTDSGANVQIWTSNNTNAQKFYLQHCSDGSYLIRNAKSGMVLDVSGGSLSDCANVQVYSSNDTAAQRWYLKESSEGTLTFISKKSGKAIDVSGGVADKGRNVQQYSPNKTAAQQWILRSVVVDEGSIYEGTYRIASALGNNLVLDIAAASSASGANLQVYTSNSTAAQRFVSTYRGNGYYSLTCLASGKVLDVVGASTANGANVQQWEWNGTGAQLWRPILNADGSYSFENKESGKVLDVDGAGAWSGNNVQQYSPNNTPAQKFWMAR